MASSKSYIKRARKRVGRKYPELKKKTNTKAEGGLLGKIAGVAGTASPLIGLGMQAVQGVFQIQANRKAAEAAEKQERFIQSTAKETELANMTSKEGKLLNIAGQEVNPFNPINQRALGGFNPTRNLEEYNTGGSHEENPNGGVQVGVGQNGKPNTIEEGETSFNIIGKDGKESEKFIFPVRIPYQPIEGLPKFVKGRTYADASKSIEKAFFGRNDKYSIDTKKELMTRLAEGLQQYKEKQSQGQTHTMPEGTVMPGATHEEYQQNQFQGGGGIYGLPGQEISVDPGILEFEQPDYSDINVLSEDETKPTSFFERNEEKIQAGLLTAGLGSQLAGVISNVRSRNRLQKADTIEANVVDPSIFSPNLINRQNILREVAHTQQSAIGAVGVKARGDFGQFAANVAGIQGKTAQAISGAMLQADTLDAAELARVQQGKAGLQQFNAQMLSQTDLANAQNLAAYENQRAAYSQGIAANIGSLGQSMINYVMGTKYAKYKGQAMEVSAFEEPYKRRRA